ncbi:collagen alpha-2(XI) chain-like [Lethenteron reissneri]|uniref:collagen alpha-2(XI) chain-like n=1 Tax=Lethenteron reissneri TaxID=7753 RepID=UPI002AB5EE5A|nr:collagen alpha-2(XI) chain-like [Lethenteron reissneri]
MSSKKNRRSVDGSQPDRGEGPEEAAAEEAADTTGGAGGDLDEIFNSLGALKRELETIKYPLGTRDNPARTCTDLRLSQPELTDGGTAWPWHRVAVSVRGTKVTLLVDCRERWAGELGRSGDARIDTRGVTIVGTRILDDEHFEGEVQQLLLVPDAGAALQQCSTYSPDCDTALPGDSELDTRLQAQEPEQQQPEGGDLYNYDDYYPGGGEEDADGGASPTPETPTDEGEQSLEPGQQAQQPGRGRGQPRAGDSGLDEAGLGGLDDDEERGAPPTTTSAGGDQVVESDYDQSEYDPVDLDPKELDPVDLDPKEYDPKEYDPGDLDPKDYDLKEYDPKEYDPGELDPKEYDPKEYDPESDLGGGGGHGGSKEAVALPAETEDRFGLQGEKGQKGAPAVFEPAAERNVRFVCAEAWADSGTERLKVVDVVVDVRRPRLLALP